MENQYLDTSFEQDQVPSDYVFGSFLRRLAALFIDGLIFSFIGFGLLAITGGLTALVAAFQEGASNLIGLMVAFLGIAFGLVIIQWLYYAYFESSEKQGTLGKQAMSLVVTDMNGNRLTFGKATIRHLARIIPTLVPYIGNLFFLADYLCQPFTEKKQTLHDMIAGTLVFKRRF